MKMFCNLHGSRSAYDAANAEEKEEYVSMLMYKALYHITDTDYAAINTWHTVPQNSVTGTMKSKILNRCAGHAYYHRINCLYCLSTGKQ